MFAGFLSHSWVMIKCWWCLWVLLYNAGQRSFVFTELKLIGLTQKPICHLDISVIVSYATVIVLQLKAFISSGLFLFIVVVK